MHQETRTTGVERRMRSNRGHGPILGIRGLSAIGSSGLSGLCVLGLCLAWGCSPVSEAKQSDVAAQGASEAASTPASTKSSDWTDEDLIYGLGLVTARTMSRLGMTPEERATFEAALRDHRTGQERIQVQKILPALAEYQKTREQQALAAETAASQAYLEAAAKREGASALPSGTIVWTIEEGKAAEDSAPPTNRDAVTVNFEARLRDGSVFDSTELRGGPQTYVFGGTLPCWAEVLREMRPGGKVKLACPASLAYGDFGQPPFVPPGAALEFDLELVDVQVGAAGIHGGMMSRPPSGGPVH